MSSNDSHKVPAEKPVLDVDDDYYFSRMTYYELLKAGMEKLENAAALAEESEHPRAYEVLGNYIKTMAEVNDKLIDLQDKMKKLQPDEMKSVDGEVVEGISISTDDLLKKLETIENDKSNGASEPDKEG